MQHSTWEIYNFKEHCLPALTEPRIIVVFSAKQCAVSGTPLHTPNHKQILQFCPCTHQELDLTLPQHREPLMHTKSLWWHEANTRCISVPVLSWQRHNKWENNLAILCCLITPQSCWSTMAGDRLSSDII